MWILQSSNQVLQATIIGHAGSRKHLLVVACNIRTKAMLVDGLCYRHMHHPIFCSPSSCPHSPRDSLLPLHPLLYIPSPLHRYRTSRRLAIALYAQPHQHATLHVVTDNITNDLHNHCHTPLSYHTQCRYKNHSRATNGKFSHILLHLRRDATSAALLLTTRWNTVATRSLRSLLAVQPLQP